MRQEVDIGFTNRDRCRTHCWGHSWNVKKTLEKVTDAGLIAGAARGNQSKESSMGEDSGQPAVGHLFVQNSVEEQGC